jgi:poly(3-hydroxybutyrate) depolymerase
VLQRVCWAVWLCTAVAGTLPSPLVAELASRPASAPVSVLTPLLSETTVEKIELPAPGKDGPAFYWLRKPAGYGAGQMPPLVIVLHGTDDTARQMVDFWSARSTRVSSLIAAPQGVGPGWRDSDTTIVRAMLKHLQGNLTYDPDRVLLAGFSAGGAMVCQLLYVEQAPVTAAAALANYVPPWLTDEQVKARRQVPVFYAVGMADVNHERMREGLQRLRSAGGRVDLYRPSVGHVLDEAVAQAALDWFFERCGESITAVLDRATASRTVADLPALERICDQRRWHEESHARRAARLMEEIESPGRDELRKARGLAAESRPADAVEVLDRIEGTFVAGRLVREAQTLRTRLEADPKVRQELAGRQARWRAAQALSMYTAAQKLVAQHKFDEAAEQCRRVADLYGETPSADRARSLLIILEKRKTQ